MARVAVGTGALSQAAMAASYWAVRRNASSASRCRVPADTVPPDRRSSSRTGWYWAGSMSTTTPAWFFAAARIIAGPPTSICSTASSKGTPAWATVFSNG